MQIPTYSLFKDRSNKTRKPKASSPSPCILAVGLSGANKPPPAHWVWILNKKWLKIAKLSPKLKYSEGPVTTHHTRFHILLEVCKSMQKLSAKAHDLRQHLIQIRFKLKQQSHVSFCQTDFGRKHYSIIELLSDFWNMPKSTKHRLISPNMFCQTVTWQSFSVN